VAEAPKIHNLYRCYDANGALLYIGVSWTAPTRFRQHSAGSRWWADVATISLERCKNRRQAETAERAAIQRERPLHNKIHATAAPVEVDEDPGLADWQVIGAARNPAGLWDVDVLPPGGTPEMGACNIAASTVAEATAEALQGCARLLASEQAREAEQSG